MITQNTTQLRSISRYSIASRVRGDWVEVRNVPFGVPVVRTTGEPTRILMVDDVRTTGSLEHLLCDLGYWKTEVASSGAAALQLAQNSLPSIVLLALELPDMSGYRLATQLRLQAAGRKLRLIALSADYAYTSRDLARQAGFERYFTKPATSSALHELLRPTLS
jgi:CheY-like chemotaxis protein